MKGDGNMDVKKRIQEIKNAFREATPHIDTQKVIQQAHIAPSLKQPIASLPRYRHTRSFRVGLSFTIMLFVVGVFYIVNNLTQNKDAVPEYQPVILSIQEENYVIALSSLVAYYQSNQSLLTNDIPEDGDSSNSLLILDEVNFLLRHINVVQTISNLDTNSAIIETDSNDFENQFYLNLNNIFDSIDVFDVAYTATPIMGRIHITGEVVFQNITYSFEGFQEGNTNDSTFSFVLYPNLEEKQNFMFVEYHYVTGKSTLNFKTVKNNNIIEQSSISYYQINRQQIELTAINENQVTVVFTMTQSQSSALLAFDYSLSAITQKSDPRFDESTTPEDEEPPIIIEESGTIAFYSSPNDIQSQTRIIIDHETGTFELNGMIP